MKCPDCKAEVEIVQCMFSGENPSFERVCFNCGWFDMRKFPTRQAAEEKKDESI